jgi:WD40 repeat protein
VVALRVLTAGVLALSEDGTLVLLRNNEAVAWRKTFEGGEACVLDVSHDGSLIAVGAGHRLYGLDGDGNQRFDVALDSLFGKELQKMEGVGQVAVAPDGSGLVVTFGGYVPGKDGWQLSNTLTRFSARGEKLWTIGGVDDKTGKPRLPDRYTSVVFSPDGGKLLLLADKTTQVLDAGTGSTVATLDGASFKTAVPLHENWLLADGEDRLVLLSPAQGKVAGQLDCAKTGPATIAPGAQGILVGSEADGAVRLVKRVEGKLDEQTIWKNVVPNKVVKQAVANLSQVAVSYWGGTLRVFDASGQLLQEQVFPQDISVLAVDGRRWIVGLADGSILALEGARP